MRTLRTLALLVLLATATSPRALAQDFKAVGAPSNPRVEVAWNRYYDYAGITEICRKLAAAHPDLVRLASIGRSTEGREMWVLTVTDFTVGDADRKPGFYIDGNIHSNEIQGTEVALYTAWYLAEMRGKVGMIDTLLATRVFYIVPTINPDAREDYMKKPNTMHSPRSGMAPRDDDGDGLFDEDGPDDLDGNGSITQIRRRDQNGRYRPSPDDPRMLSRAEPGQTGEYELLGEEGIDNDGDGQVNEDGPGFYDPNRDWGWNWQPRYVQYGADRYPFTLQENRNVRDFVLTHRNIAGAQSYHNAGGMILRPPGAEEDASIFSNGDVAVYDVVGKRGEEMLPGYKYMTTYKDLYTTYGGEVDWFFGMRGVFAFTNELWSSFNMFGKKQEELFGTRRDQFAFDRYLLFGEGIVDWHTVDHPQYGPVEVGGATKNYTRLNPSFLIEEMAHRNMAFTIYHAWQMPQLVVQRVAARPIGNGLTEVTATIANTRAIPTHSDWDVKNRISRPDWITLAGATVLSGSVVADRNLGLADEQKHHPERIAVPTIPGQGYVTVRWITKGKGPFTVMVDSEKGGVVVGEGAG
jgi:hypothetical protein